MKITTEKLKSLIKSGLSVKAIAKIFSCTRQAIYKTMKNNGIKLDQKSIPKKILCSKCLKKIEKL